LALLWRRLPQARNLSNYNFRRPRIDALTGLVKATRWAVESKENRVREKLERCPILIGLVSRPFRANCAWSQSSYS